MWSLLTKYEKQCMFTFFFYYSYILNNMTAACIKKSNFGQFFCMFFHSLLILENKAMHKRAIILFLYLFVFIIS